MEERQTLRQATKLWQEAYRYQMEGELDDVRTVLDPPLRGGEPQRRALNGLVRDAVDEPQEHVIDIVVEMEFPGWRPAKHSVHRAPPSGQ